MITFVGIAADLHVNEGSNKVWKTHATKAIAEAITMQLNSRLIDLGTDDTQEDHGNLGESHETLAAGGPIWNIGAEQPGQTRQQMLEGKKGRKDLFGIGNAIDRFATNAITGNKAATLAKKYKDLLEEAGLSLDAEGRNSDPIHNQRVQPIAAGSQRANDRLKEAGLID